MRKTHRIVIAEDQHLVRKGLISLITKEEKYEVVGEAADGLEAIRNVVSHEPDLVLLDLAMPKMNGISAIKEIKKTHPNTKILVVTFHKSDEYILSAFEAGADGYCLKNDTHAELMDAIQNVLAGKKHISADISEFVLKGFLEGKKTIKSETDWETLTKREKEILKLVGEGYKSLEIADFLCISVSTVDRHRANMMKKLNLHSASQLAVYATQKGLIEG